MIVGGVLLVLPTLFCPNEMVVLVVRWLIDALYSTSTEIGASATETALSRTTAIVPGSAMTGAGANWPDASLQAQTPMPRVISKATGMSRRESFTLARLSLESATSVP